MVVMIVNIMIVNLNDSDGNDSKTDISFIQFPS